MLDYQRNRLDYGEMLIPPQGYRLAKAIAATYSLDLNTLLSIPIALFYAQTMEGTCEGERIQLLEAIQRCPEVLRIYHQTGQIHVPRNQNRLFGLLEDCVVEVPPKSAYSSFHPKVWILRYVADSGPVRYRLIVLSRNLTYDRSWDIAANLDGDVTDTVQERNQPLVDFARHLLDHEPFAGAESFVEGLSRVEFATPKGFNGNFRFHPIGIGNYRNPIQNQTGEGVICITPFVHDVALAKLCQNVPEQRWLFCRREELRRLKKETLEGINTFCLSSVIVDGESISNGEDGDLEPLEQNLHAKLFIYKRKGRGNIWFVGSANATKAAFERNVEFLLEMRGSSDAVQFETILDDLLGPERDVGVFEPFQPSAEPVDEGAQHALEQRIRQLEFDLFDSLEVVRSELVQSKNTRNFDLLLTLQPAGTAWTDLEVKLAPFNSDHTTQVLAPAGQTEFRFENINESNLSRFLRFEIYHNKELQCAFLMKIDIAGMPTSRISQIIKGIISDRDKFFEYLRFLLADAFDKEAMDDGNAGSKGSADDASGLWDVKSPIFEQLLITASRRPGRLKEIDGIIQQLMEGVEHDDNRVVPQEFLTLWEAFRGMISKSTEPSP
jgi:hypothetical protein